MNPSINGEQLDSGVVKVMRAIRDVESGGDYSATGDSGAAHGAFQYNEQTGPGWKNVAREFLGNENAPMDKANQNQATYRRMKKWKDEGKQPEEIAALWNGASKDPQSGRYTYNAPEYGVKFRAAMQKSRTPQEPQEPQRQIPEAPTKTDYGAIAKDIVLDPIKVLLAKPAARVAEAVGRTGVLGENIKRGYEEISDSGEGQNLFGMHIEKQKGFEDGGLKQIGGDALKTASYLYGGGKASSVLGNGVKQSIKTGSKIGAVGGGLYGAGEEMQNTDSTFGSIAKAGAIGSGIGAVGGGLFGAATPAVVKGFSNIATRRQAKIEEAVKNIIRGNPEDNAAAKKVISELDVEGVTTGEELAKVIKEKIVTLSEGLDDALETNTARRVLNQMKVTQEVNGQSVSHNFVQDALQQLFKFYKSTNAPDKQALITQILKKAQTEGLDSKAINDIARLHGKDLNAYNANGRLASGLNKQAAEATRKGVKTTSRQIFGNKIAKEIDKEISNLIRVETLVKKMVLEVNKLESKIKSRSPGEQIHRLAAEVVDVASFGLARGIMKALAPRGQGIKTLNALDWEKQLSKNLKLITEANKATNEATIIQKLNQFLETTKGKKQPLRLPAGPKKGTSGNPIILGPKDSGPGPGSVKALKGEVIRNPKTGRFERTYLSGDGGQTPAQIVDIKKNTPLKSPQMAKLISVKAKEAAKKQLPSLASQPKITNLNKFERGKDLTPEKQALEDKAFAHILKDESKLLDEYFVKHGKTVNADDFRPLFKKDGYTDGHLAAGVQEPSSYLAKRARTILLKKNPGDYVVGTAGGSGAGKTAAARGIKDLVDLQKDAAMILDSNFSTEKSARKFIQEANDAGKEFIGVFTYREFMDSIENGVVKRMLTNKSEMGRLVPTKVVAGNHFDSWRVVKKLNDEGVIFSFLDNSLGQGKAKLISVDEMARKIKYSSKEDMTKKANELVKKLYESKKPFIDDEGVTHRITKAQYDSLIE